MLLILLISMSLIRLTDAANLSDLIDPLLTVARTWIGCKLHAPLSLSLFFSLFLSPGFVVFVGLVLPAAMIAMWMFWECCYEVDEEDEENNRSATPRNPSPFLSPNTYHPHKHTQYLRSSN